MTIYPDAINVVKAQRRISGFTTPDEFASRNGRAKSLVAPWKPTDGGDLGRDGRGADDGRKLLFWQNDKYESKVIFARSI